LINNNKDAIARLSAQITASTAEISELVKMKFAAVNNKIEVLIRDIQELKEDIEIRKGK